MLYRSHVYLYTTVLEVLRNQYIIPTHTFETLRCNQLTFGGYV
jgi:hypothetical protein